MINDFILTRENQLIEIPAYNRSCIHINNAKYIVCLKNSIKQRYISAAYLIYFSRFTIQAENCFSGLTRNPNKIASSRDVSQRGET